MGARCAGRVKGVLNTPSTLQIPNGAKLGLRALLPDEHGEGVFRICFNFPDRDEALDRATSMGIEVRSRFDVLDLFPQWRNRVDRVLESHLEHVHGVSFNFCQVDTHAAAEVS